MKDGIGYLERVWSYWVNEWKGSDTNLFVEYSFSWGDYDWTLVGVNPSLRNRMVPLCLKGSVDYPLLKCSPLDQVVLYNCHPTFNLLFMGKVVRKMAAQKVQRILEVHYLDLFQTVFRPKYGTEIALITFLHGLWWEQFKVGAFVLLLNLSVAFDINNHNIILIQFCEMGGTVLCWFWEVCVTGAHRQAFSMAVLIE